MSTVVRKILWADDEIDSLKPHILLLEQKGFRVTPVTNGTTPWPAPRARSSTPFSSTSRCPGWAGSRRSRRSRSATPSVPVVLVTKNEAES
jgi:DNA-binding NtrC family response regulator